MGFDVSATFNAIDAMSSPLGAIAGIAADTGRNILNAFSGASEGMSLAEAGSAALGIGMSSLGALASEAISQFTQLDDAMASLSVRTGTNAADMAVYEQETRALFDSGLVSNWDQAAQAIGAASLMTAGLPVDQAERFAIDATAVGKAWGQAPTQVIQAVQKFTAQFSDLAGKPIEALDILVKAAQNTNQPLSAIENTVQRYGPKFAAAGLDGLGMGAMIMVGASLGAGPQGMGALASAVDNFHSNVEKPSAGFTAAMKALSLGPVVTDLQNNTMTMDQALVAIGKSYETNTLPPTAKAALLTAIFGSSIKGIDADKFATGLANMGTDMKSLADSTGAGDAAATKMTGSFGGMLDKFKNTSLDVLEKSFQSFIDNLPKTMTDIETGINKGKDKIVGAIGGITSGVSATWTDWFGAGGKLAGWAQAALNDAETNVITAKAAFVTAVSGIVSDATATWNDWFGPSGKLQTSISTAWTAVQSAVNGAVAGISAAFAAISKAIGAALQPALDAINAVINGINWILQHAGGGGGVPQINMGSLGAPGGHGGGHASGGDLAQGWNTVGEQGMEAIFMQGSRATVYTNQQTRQMLGSGGGGGSSTVINNNVGTLIGSNGMTELARILAVELQNESKRRGGSSLVVTN